MMNSNEPLKSDSTGGNCGQRCGRRLWKIPFIVAAIILIKSVLVLLLWNALIPPLFHGPMLTYLQALGLTVLAKVLIGFGGPRPFGGRFGHGWKSRWAALSSEEREKLREEIRHRCGG